MNGQRACGKKKTPHPLPSGWPGLERLREDPELSLQMDEAPIVHLAESAGKKKTPHPNPLPGITGARGQCWIRRFNVVGPVLAVFNVLLAVFNVLILLFAMSSASAMAADQKTVKDRMTDMKLMSPLERDRLNRNIQDFQTLSSSQKTQFRNLHAELIDDRVHNGGMTSLMQTYTVWLSSLTPAQREAIKNETDAARKLEIVRRIKDETDHSNASHEAHPDVAAVPTSSRLPKGMLDGKDVSLIMMAVVERLPQGRIEETRIRASTVGALPSDHQ